VHGRLLAPAPDLAPKEDGDGDDRRPDDRRRPAVPLPGRPGGGVGAVGSATGSAVASAGAAGLADAIGADSSKLAT